MKYFLVSIIFSSFLFGYTCEELIKKYNAPNPEYKTMKQLRRWVENNIDEFDKYKDTLLDCLIENAADNPNRETIAAE